MGRSPCCSKEGMNRGAWTAEEDQLLTRYIQSHGVGKWRNLPKKAGLNRCGKSCRLRWLNYLRPDIKRGNISPDEEDLIIRLHKLLGNRWSLIAGRLPGRTDNEIKNYWNTNLGKRVLLEKRFTIPASSSTCLTKPRSRKLMISTSSDAQLVTTKKYSFSDQQVIKTKALKCSSNQLLFYQQPNLAMGKRSNNIDTLETSSSNELSCVDGTSSNSHTNNAPHEGSDELIMTMDFGAGPEISLSDLLLGCEDGLRDLCDFNMINSSSSSKGTDPELLISSEEMLDEATWNNIDVIDHQAAA